MKKLTIVKLSVWLLLLIGALNGRGQTIVYNSPNASTDGVSPQAMLHLDFRSLYALRADLSGGIIGTVNSGGVIRLEVFEYDPNKPGGVGDLLYGKFSQSTTTDYGGLAETHSVTGTGIDDAIITMTDNVKALGQNSSIYTAGGPVVCLPPGSTLLNAVFKEGFTPTSDDCEARERFQPVIIRVTQTNAVATSVKVPGIGIYTLPQKDHRPFIPYGGPFGKVTVGAHRGNWESNLTPENTRSALSAALANNVDMIELDIAMTSDGVPVIFHDNGLVKRTTFSGAIANHPSGDVLGLSIRNRFDEFVSNDPSVVMISLEQALTQLQSDPKKTFINLDKSANDMNTFKAIYQIAQRLGMLDRCIFKGRFVPGSDQTTDVNKPTVAGFRQAFSDMFPGTTLDQRDQLFRDIYFTPVMFDNDQVNNDDAMALNYYQYMFEFIQGSFADGFELNFKANPAGSNAYAIDNNAKIILLRKWSVTGNRTFVEYVHSYNLPVGFFASEPEVGAVPQYAGSPTDRELDNLVSGTVFEDVASQSFLPHVQDQGNFDFRGDPDFYIKAGADYVITDRPDQLFKYLQVIGRSL